MTTKEAASTTQPASDSDLRSRATPQTYQGRLPESSPAPRFWSIIGGGGEEGFDGRKSQERVDGRPMRRRGILTILALALVTAGCGATLIQAPPLVQLRRHEGPSLPLTAYVSLELRAFQGGPRNLFAPPEGVLAARSAVRQKVEDSGLFRSVEEVEGAPPARGQAVLLKIALDIFITRPAFGQTGFAPHAYLTVVHYGPEGATQTLSTNAHYETYGVAADSLDLYETVMLAWRAGGNAIAAQMANDLPRLLASTPAGARLLALGSSPDQVAPAPAVQAPVSQPAAPSPARPAEGVTISIGYPQPDARIQRDSVVLAGTISGPAPLVEVQISVNGRPAPAPQATGEARAMALSQQIALDPGENVIVVNARDRAGGLGQRVVRVFREAESQAEPASAGSGFRLRNTNLVLTNDHVVRDKAQIKLVFPSGEEFQGRVVLRDRSNDLALVEARGLTATTGGVVLSLNAELKVGETVHAVGYPLGGGLSRKPSMVSGVISSTSGVGDDISRFRTTAPINPGNSGGPIVNQKGEIIGIATSGLVRREVEAIRFGIRASAAALLLQQAQATTAFDVRVTPAAPHPRSPDQIFQDVSPHVVLIEAR
jgi:S1-C subfamily serine protease